MRRLGRNFRQRQPKQQLTAVQKALLVLRKFGTNAHIWIPGVGQLNGLTAGNYIDSAGTTLGAYDNPVGLGLDGLGSLGVELATASTGWTPPSGVTVNATTSSIAFSGTQSAYAVVFASATVAATVGKTYFVSYTVTGLSAGGVQVKAGGVSIGAKYADGTYSGYVVATTTDGIVVQEDGSSGSRFVGTVSGISSQEITGIHASQATTGSKPILRLGANGKSYWQFDGGDSLALSGPVFQMSDDHCVVAGFNPTTINGYQAVTNLASNSASNARVCATYMDAGNQITTIWTNDAGTSFPATISGISVGITYVSSAICRSGSAKARLNGGAFSSTVNPTGATALNTGVVGGGNGVGSFVGSIYPIIAIKGTVSDADLLALERFVGLMSGVTI